MTAVAIIKVECAGCKTVDYVDSKHKRPSTWYLGAEGKNYCPSCADKICKVDSEDTANVPIYIDDLLLGLIEECGEVIQAATKCLRFGYTTEGPHDYGYNHVKLSEELGDVLGIIDALPMKNVKAMENMRSSKIERMKKAKVWHRANGDAASLKG